MCRSDRKDVEIRKIGNRSVSMFRWFQGMMCSSIFSLTYLFGPLYILSSGYLLLSRPSSMTLTFAAPLLISALFPPITSPFLVSLLRPMLDYFEYEQIIESSPVDVRQEILDGKPYLIVAQPHGVISFCGICSAINHPEFMIHIKAAVASAVLSIPFIKHVMGIFGLCSASKASLRKTMQKHSVVLYVGGMAELFLTCRNEERIFLRSRKGFIKLALTEGIDVVPIYLFGNTSILTVLKAGLLSTLSRKLQVSLTLFYGKWGLPIPRDDKLLYVGGQPLGIPHIPNPTQQDIDHWHALYCAEVIRLFETYKERIPLYKHKKLIIE